MNDDSSLRSSRVVLTAGIVICSVLAVCSLMNLTPGRMPGVLSVGREKPAAVREANRQLSRSYAEFYPNQYRSTGAIRTVSQSEEQPIIDQTAVASEPQVERDVFQKDRVIDIEHTEKEEFGTSVHRAGQLSTSTVVEAGGNLVNESNDDSADKPNQSSDREASPAPLPHITVPVTVNVDNGEILTELMRLQEEVIVTRQQLADSHEAAGESPSTIPAEPSDVPKPLFDPVSTANTNDEAKHAVVVEKKAVVRTLETSESVTSTETMAEVFGTNTDAKDTSEQKTAAAEPAPEFPPAPETPEVAVSEPDMAFEPEPETELPDFGDFSEPNPGPSNDASEEDLPAFELPPQTKTSRSSSLNSYAEWVQSFEEPRSEQVTQVTYEEELPSFPAIEVNPVTTEPVTSEVTTPMLTIPAEPSFDAVNTTVAIEQPSTPVPPVPGKAVDTFHEPSTIPVFPVTSTTTEPVAQTTTQASTKQVADNVQFPAATASKPAAVVGNAPPTGTRKPVSKVATARSQQAQRSTGKPSSYQSQTPQKSGPSIASRLKGIASPSKPEATKSPGMMARMKSRMSTAVSKVPKPDFDTPMWVDRIADWKDERFGKKNSTEPQMANPSTTIASQVPQSQVSGHQHSMAQSAPATSRSSSVRQPVTRVPGASSNVQVARSTSQARPNVTMVPRSGRPQPQTSRTVVVQAPQPTQEHRQHQQQQQPAALTAQTQPVPSLPVTSSPGPSSPVPAIPEQTVSGAAYTNDASKPAQKPITQTAHSTVNVPPAALPEIHRSQPRTVRAPVNVPPGVQQGRDAYYGVVTDSGHGTFEPTYSEPVTQHAQVAYPVVQEQACDVPTEYVGTLDAFNYRMTMVIRPPSLSNLGSNPVSRWFSNANSASSSGASPTVHRVGSAMRYSTQPKTVR